MKEKTKGTADRQQILGGCLVGCLGGSLPAILAIEEGQQQLGGKNSNEEETENDGEENDRETE